MSARSTLACTLRGHAPGAEQIENNGVRFARCRRCGTDLIQEKGAWQPVPKGYRIVWRPPPAREGTPSPEAPPTAGAHSPAPPPTSSPSVRQRDATILVCDDDPLILDLLEHRLSGRGYRVELANDGREALATVAKRRPDAVVLDAMMPNVDGFEVLRRLRDADLTRRIPVVMLTARRQERDIVGALELGADDFISKPFIPEELLSRLARLLADQRV